ncbi:pantoate--beta-alanine ligase [Flagellimonas lutaonensis]|uniref:Pantothenate synthetase n=1 Tax=Flagellimonas lutaonensis TaxID=516051 RepID=A0A0D5YSA3_9FLAO|nr:pantoate--beta-alanine ligase [Allomuricauda lutaonensis]AKA34794.1 Pantothenate synthetase [Allomuricauda lutaonensis]
MHLIEDKRHLQAVLAAERQKNHSIGLVPTMGALHYGHLSLVKRALSENGVVVVSIFVNPTQFDNQNDLKNYPSNLERDLDLLNALSEDILVFAPSKTEIYPGEIAPQKFKFGGLEKTMEGQYRNGHFDGVATIVELLLKTVGPDKAYFGEKDFQQLQIVRKLVRSKQIPVEIIGCPIQREANGLAMSSRNERLPKEVRQRAGFIFETLKTAKRQFGMKSADYLRKWVKDQFKANNDFDLEYFEITDEEKLAPIQRKRKNKKYRAFIAVYAKGVRLIDNIALN